MADNSGKQSYGSPLEVKLSIHCLEVFPSLILVHILFLQTQDEFLWIVYHIVATLFCAHGILHTKFGQITGSVFFMTNDLCVTNFSACFLP